MALHRLDIEALRIVIRRGVVTDPGDAYTALGERIGAHRADIAEALNDGGRAAAFHADAVERAADQERHPAARGLAPAQRAAGGDRFSRDDLVDGLALIHGI